MFFSIVIPLYNKSYSIERCINSVLSQSFKNFELIIVNDGSTDDSTQKVLNCYSNEISSGKIKLINQPNRGVSIARNKGVKASKSEYICFLDADDEWKKDFLINIKRLILDFPSANLYCLQHEMKLEDRIPIRNTSLYKNGFRGYVDNFFKASLFGSIANSSKVCIKKKCLLKIGGFPENQISGEDLYVWMELARLGKVAFENQISVRINILTDDSRAGRDMSIPYPFIYYSQPHNLNKLSFWSKLYLRKVYLAHIKESLINKHYEALYCRSKAGNKIFPIISKPFIVLSAIKK